MYILMVGIASAAIYSVLIPISLDTGLTLGDLNAGTGYMFLAFGWGCLFWQPIALQYGKRPVYLISILATAGIMIWAAHTNTNGQWIASKVLQGFVGAPIESLCEVSITDVYFTHERGTYIALYGLLLAGSNFFAPIIAGFINDGQGWQWVLYWCAIFCGIGFVYIFFFLEETNFSRSTITGVEEPTKDDINASYSSKGADTEVKSSQDLPTAATYQEGLAGPTKTFWQKVRLFEPDAFSKPNRLAAMFARPLIFLSFPVAAYSGFFYGASLVWFNVLNGTASLILSGEPYNFAPSMVGVAYVSPLIGVFISSVYCGKGGDWLVVKLARRAGGIMEPEHRLWLLVPFILLAPFGLILWGVGASPNIHVHWFGLVFAMGVIAAFNVAGLQVSLAYCIDTYRDLAGEMTVTVILIRNTMSFAVSYGITPWVTNMGYQNAFILAGFAAMAQILTFLIFVKWGKKLRRASAQRFLRYVEELRAAGLVH